MKYPFVSVVIPVKNEEDYIEGCLESLINQDYPKNKYEIIIADGMSDDKTKEIIKNIKKKNKFPKIRVFDNKKITTASGFNLGVKKSKGECVVRMIGHAIASEKFIGSLVKRILKTNNKIAGIGCAFKPIGRNKTQKLISYFIKSEFYSFGNKSYRFWRLKKERFINGFSFGCFKKKHIINALPNDIRVVGDDATISKNIKSIGLKLILIPETLVYFYPRNNFLEFLKQQLEFIRFKIIKK